MIGPVSPGDGSYRGVWSDEPQQVVSFREAHLLESRSRRWKRVRSLKAGGNVDRPAHRSHPSSVHLSFPLSLCLIPSFFPQASRSARTSGCT